MAERSTSGDAAADHAAPPSRSCPPMFGVYGADQLSGEGFGRRALAKLVDVAILNIAEMAALMMATIVFAVLGAVMGFPLRCSRAGSGRRPSPRSS